MKLSRNAPSTSHAVPSRRGVASGSSTPWPGGLVPTKSVTTKDGTTVRARIDPTLAVDDVIGQLCMNLKVSEPPVLFALRDEADELVTDESAMPTSAATSAGESLIPSPTCRKPCQQKLNEFSVEMTN